MRTLLALLLAMVAFAGCLDGDSATTDDELQDDTPEEEVMTPDIQTTFEFGPGAGCTGDVLQIGGLNCVAFQNGPGNDGPDGFWVPLTDDYIGVDFRATVQNALGDSDCHFADDEGTMVGGDYNNGQGPCGGAVPLNASWLFVYSYAEPHQGITVTFTP